MWMILMLMILCSTETVNWLIKQLTHVDAIVHADDPSFAILLGIGSIIRGKIATVL